MTQEVDVVSAGTQPGTSYMGKPRFILTSVEAYIYILDVERIREID